MQNPRYRGPTVNIKFENDAAPLIDSTFSQRAKPIRSLQLCGERTSIQSDDPIIDHPLIEWLLFISGIFYDTALIPNSSWLDIIPILQMKKQRLKRFNDLSRATGLMVPINCLSMIAIWN